MNNSSEINVFWFRRDLNIDENVGLFYALKSKFPVLPIFIFDNDILDLLENKNDKRIDLIFQIVQNIKIKLEKIGSSLLILKGKPIDVFANLTKEYNIKQVFSNYDYETYAIKRDFEINEILFKLKIEFLQFKDQVIFDKNDILKADGKPYSIFTPYMKAWKKKYFETNHQLFYCKECYNNFIKIKPFKNITLNEIGFNPTGIKFEEAFINEDIIKNYDKTRDYPSNEGTSKLSFHLRFGTVSIRNLIKKAFILNEIWLNELIWREFYKMILFHFPRVEKLSFKKNFENLKFRNNEKEFEAWCLGKTGYPIVDAGMRELNETGFMHNRLRMITASFLIKHLLIDWRWGEAYFAEKLLDYDLSANNGGWQWAASTGCDAVPYFRIFNPSEQTKKFDSNFEYIKKYVPEFCSFEYPKPIVEHKFARERAIETYKNIKY